MNSTDIKISVEPNKSSVKQEELLGAVPITLDGKEAKKKFQLREDEVFAVRPSQFKANGSGLYGVTLLSMTNQRFIVSKDSNLKRSFLISFLAATGFGAIFVWLFGTIIQRTIKLKGIPTYEIPFSHIKTMKMDGKVLSIVTKDNQEYIYALNENHKLFAKQIELVKL